MRGKAHPRAAKEEIEEWALESSNEVLRKELVQYAMTTKATETETEVVSEDSLKEMTLDAQFQELETHTPN